MLKEIDSVWKISNNSEQPIKVAVSLSSIGSIGLILQKDEFCLAKEQMTRSIDSQEKRGFIVVDRSYKNIHHLDMGKIYHQNVLSEIELSNRKVEDYKNSNS
jgi:hypothetical protein